MDNNLPTDDNQKPVTPVETPPPLTETPTVIPETPEETPPTTPPVIEETPPITLPEEPKQEIPEPTIEIGSLGQPSLSTLQDVGGKPSSKSKKIKTVASVLGLLLIITALPLAVVLVKQRQELRKEAQMSGGTATCGIQVGPPSSETPPSASNNGTYSISVPVRNTSGSSATINYEKYMCACPEGGGNPSGQCNQNCRSEPGNMTLANGANQNVDLSVRQDNGQVCGSFQVDLFITSVNNNPNCKTK